MQNQNFGWRDAAIWLCIFGAGILVLFFYCSWRLTYKPPTNELKTVSLSTPQPTTEALPNAKLRRIPITKEKYQALLKWMSAEEKKVVWVGGNQLIVTRESGYGGYGFETQIKVHKATERWHLYWTIESNMIKIDPSHEGSPSRDQLLQENLLLERFWEEVLKKS